MSFELRNVVKHYPSRGETVRAIDGISLKIEGGEFVALYGPSGSGKTTLLMLAAGLLAPDSGSVLFDERDVGAMSDRESATYRLRDVGFVFQSFHLMPAATAVDNALIKLPLLGYTVHEARQKATVWLERVGLGDRLDHLPEQLSIGQRQRVAIARALVGKPNLLLADEPTGNLDSTRTRETLELLRGICHERCVPGVLVTHDPDAVGFVDRVVNLRGGVLTEGPGINTTIW
ncbi:MAG TPA: ABC transporter ATP-binding protein [Solirubrobacteraceae bacterium]